MATVAEARRAQRLRTFKGGLIMFGVASPIGCLIRNLSTTGAALEVEREQGIPDAFTLLIKPEFLKRKCRVTWRAGKRMGVQFR